MQILFLSGRETSYSRNHVLLHALHRMGQVDVIGSTLQPRSLVIESIRVMLRALPRLLFHRYDLVFVGFYGHLLMLVVGCIAQFRRMPVLFDVFVSNYDTLVQDRQTIPHDSMSAKLAGWLDSISCSLANHLLLDTTLHVDYFVQSYQLPREKFSVLPVGCNEDIFSSRQVAKVEYENGESKVLYYCTYLPLHGAEVVIQAAKILEKEPIQFHLIGNGQEYERVRKLAEGLKNVQFSPPLPLTNLRDQIEQADICLGGHFGSSDKAGRVIPGKVYQILAMARPLVASDSPANRGLLVNKESAFLVQPGNAPALAEAILTLHNDPVLRERIRQNGRVVYETLCSEAVITDKLTRIVQTMVSRGTRF